MAKNSEAENVQTENNTPGLPSPGASVENIEAPKPEGESELATIVAESKAKLAGDDTPPPKSGRGRRLGSKNKPKGGETAAAPSTDQVNAQAAEMVKGAMSPAHLSTGIQLLGERAAGNTGFEGWKVPKEEADGLAQLADSCMQRYFPNLSDTHALLAITIFSFGMAIGGRYIGYQDFQRKTGKIKPVEVAPEIQKAEAIHAKENPASPDSFFKKT